MDVIDVDSSVVCSFFVLDKIDKTLQTVQVAIHNAIHSYTTLTCRQRKYGSHSSSVFVSPGWDSADSSRWSC